MREIKFRVWDKELLKFSRHLEIDCFGNIQEYKFNGSAFYPKFQTFETEFADLPSSKDRFVIQEWTGLHDKNGKEIYEGDIVEVNGWKYTIIFRGMGFWFVDSDDDGWVYDQNVYLITVLGNIYENSDLLNND